MKSLQRLLLGVLLLGATAAHAQKNIANEELDSLSGTRLQVRSVFDPLPPSGYAPMRIVATNGTGRNARWGFDFHSQTQHYPQQNAHRSSFALDVPARSTQSALFMVPVAVDYGDRSVEVSGHVLRVDFSGTGFDVGSKNEHENRVTGRTALALSETLAELDRFIAAMIASFTLLAQAMRFLPAGTSYAIWVGIGAVGVAIFGMVYLKEPATIWRITCITLILLGVLGLKLR
jgi:multidrug transporter EmrE-like cation transporter